MLIKCPKCDTENPSDSKYCKECATPLPSPEQPSVSHTKTLETPTEELTTGSTFAGRYQIIEELGRGGMGRVYRAVDKKLNEEVALKLIKPEIALEKRTLERFHNELKLARKISHANVGRMYELLEEKGVNFITMEYVQGEDLKSSIRRFGQVPISKSISIAKQICEGLEEAHKKGVIHRDLKPSNIMIDRDGNTKIMDFGIARSLRAKKITGEGVSVGTPEYMSPEQVEGKEADQRADIYSLGIILYEMVTGRVPFEGDTPLSIAMKHKNEIPTDPIKLNPQIPKDLNHLIMKCLEKDRDNRYQRADIVHYELEKIEKSLPGTTKVVSKRKSYMLKKIILKKPFILALAVLFVIFVLLFLTWRFNLLKHKPELIKQVPKTVPESVLLLVADFQNKTGEQVFSGAFEKALSTGLSNTSFISIFPREKARERVNLLDPGAGGRLDGLWAQLVSRNERINVLVDGSIEKTNEGYKIEAWALDPINSNKIAETSSVIQTRAETLKATDRLAGEIADQLKMRLQFHIFSTTSLEAMKAYAQGQTLAKNGKIEESIQQYKRAIEIDSNFGYAYTALALGYLNIGNMQLAEKYFIEAIGRVDQMSEREKYRTRGIYYLFKHNYKRAIEEYQELLKKFPSDPAGKKDLASVHTNLAFAYFQGYRMKEAFQEGLHAIELDPEDPSYRYNQSWYALASGDFDRARLEARKTLEIDPSYAKAFVVLALAELAQDRLPEASKIYEQLKSLSEEETALAYTGSADLALYEGRVEEAIGILNKGIAFDLEKKWGKNYAADKYLMLGQAYLLQGKNSLALDAANKALETYGGEEIMFAAAQIYIEAGDEEKARTLAGELSKKVQDVHKSYAKLIGGYLSLKRGDVANASKCFDEALSLVDTWLARFALGRAYLETKAFNEALSEFEKCVKRRGEAMSMYLNDFPTFRYLDSLDYYMGRAQEGLKSPVAKESFEDFLKIKEKADPGNKLVDDARKRLNSL